ncbi:MAG TPA: hypothetical protein ENJ52_02330 [Aliiroseovarius sp.]|nr:hypothetical protein [Aliiroseovarius sp.]
MKFPYARLNARMRAFLKERKHGLSWPEARELDRARFDRDMARPMPETRFVMFFTPRSGSSWLCDLVNRSRRLGVLGEAFNPKFMPRMSRAMNAANLDEYCQVLPRRQARGGVFGFQITYHQLNAVFADEQDFLRRFASWHSFWLIRRDIVLQAVSLYKMQQTGLAHAPQATPERIGRRERDLAYDGDGIRHWLLHILAAERATEALIARAGFAPLRMSYERNTALKPNHLLNVMGRHMGLATMRMKPLRSPHGKIGTDLNTQFAERFRRDQSDLVARIEEERGPLLARIPRYGPKQRQARTKGH